MDNKNIKTNQNKIYLLLLTGFFLASVLPLLNLGPWFSPPDWGKTIVFRTILSIIIFIFLCQILYKKQFSIKTSLPFWMLISLFGVYLFATIFSLDPSFSLWGSPYRSGGFVNFAFYIVFSILAFIIIKKSSWGKIWNFNLLIGVLISVIAVFQHYSIFPQVFIFSVRPVSTIGGPTFLASYLLLLSFLSLSFGIITKNIGKKIFYFTSFLLFIFVSIILTQCRAVFLGLFSGLFWFIFFYSKKMFLMRLLTLFFLFLGIFGFYFLKNHPGTYSHETLTGITIDRILSISNGDASRLSAWKISLSALKNRPILGYGPENFSIGFEKNYDPALPSVTKDWGSWWDRAHNFIFDISVTAGIPALIIYLALFGTLFLKLQKLKKLCPEEKIIAHGIQATFIAYLTANLFNFDTFSAYLVSFLMIGYSFFLISENIPEKIFSFNTKGKYMIISVFFSVLILFIWNFNIKPFQINTQINISKYLAENNNCEQAIERMEKALGAGKTFLDPYLRQKYVSYLTICSTPEKDFEFTQKGYQLMKESVAEQPYYTRNWIVLGRITNALIAKEKNFEIKEKLKNETNSYFGKAQELSPKHQEIFIEWAKTDFLTGDYQGAKEKAQKCIDLNSQTGDCWWLMALSNIYLDSLKDAQENLDVAASMGYNINSKDSLFQLINAYNEVKNYKKISEIYQQLINNYPNNASYHASLASTYKELEEYKKARDEALKTLELAPDWKESVEEFLKTLP